LITMQHLVVSHTECIHVGGPKNLGDVGAHPLWWGCGRPPRNTLFPTCVTVPNLVILGETVECNYGDLPEKFDPSCSAF